jgi:UDP-galactopyranose mutase
VGYDHVFYTGPIDAWFGHALGRLAYRTLDFVTERHVGDHQGNAVINHCDPEVPWTRVSEHKHFSPWESHEQTLIYKEYSRECGVLDTPYYPVRLLDDKTLLHQYVTWAQQEKRVTFLGRLATYRYLDMHITIDEALQTAHLFLDCARRGAPMPAFALDPLN